MDYKSQSGVLIQISPYPRKKGDTTKSVRIIGEDVNTALSRVRLLYELLEIDDRRKVTYFK